jgi:hypothetical protein
VKSGITGLIVSGIEDAIISVCFNHLYFGLSNAHVRCRQVRSILLCWINTPKVTKTTKTCHLKISFHRFHGKYL